MQAFFNGDGVSVRDCHAFQGMIEGTMYNLWGMKEQDYIMLMIAINGLMGGNELAGWPVVGGMRGGSRLCGHFIIHAHLTGISSIGMRWMITTTYSLDCL